MDREMVSLDGYVVRRKTGDAVGLAKAVAPLGREGALVWIPRSLCEDGRPLDEGDTDIVVAQWKADDEGLDY